MRVFRFSLRLLMILFWVFAPCICKMFRHFGGIYCLHLQDKTLFYMDASRTFNHYMVLKLNRRPCERIVLQKPDIVLYRKEFYKTAFNNYARISICLLHYIFFATSVSKNSLLGRRVFSTNDTNIVLLRFIFITIPNHIIHHTSWITRHCHVRADSRTSASLSEQDCDVFIWKPVLVHASRAWKSEIV